MPVRLCLPLLLFAIALTPATAQGVLRWGFGLEVERSQVRPVEYVEIAGQPGKFTMRQVGDLQDDGWDARVAVMATWSVTDAFQVGLRASQGVGFHGSDFMASGGVIVPVPRANLTLQYQLIPEVAVGIEFPYNPAISVRLGNNHYLAVGSDNVPDSVGQRNPHTSFTYVFLLD